MPVAEACEPGSSARPPVPSRGAKPGRRLQGRVAHCTRGRVRLHFRGASREELQQIEAHLSTLPHVNAVEVRPGSASVIAHHEVGHDLVSTLGDLSRRSALFYLELAEDSAQASAQLTDVEHDVTYLADHSKTGKAIIRYAEHLNRGLKQATGGWMDLRVLVPATAGLCALVFIEIESAPLWLPLALFSFQSFNNLHEPHPTTEAEAGGPSAVKEKSVRLPDASRQSSAAAQAKPENSPTKKASRKPPVVRLKQGQEQR